MTVAGQPAVNYTFDNANRLTNITQGTSTVQFAYDNANRRTALTLPNSIVTSYGYDNASELTGLTYTLNSNSLGSLTYTYDLAGRRTNVGGSDAATNLPNAITTTAYDAANELTQWGTATPTYDATGNMLSDGTNSFVWNARNKLASMNMSTESFQYDPLGRRVAKTVLAATTNYLYDGVNPVQELSGTTPTANLMVGGVDEYFQRTDSVGAENFLTDALGNTAALTNATGTNLAQYAYEPFGNTTITGGSASAYQYTGRENDGTGLYFYRARYYNPALQRFVSEDPAGIGGGINFYAYALNDPLLFVDPDGLDVTVTGYPGVGGNPFGHVGISVDGSPTVGFNPAPGWDPVAVVGPITPELGIVPGAVLPVDPGRPLDPGCSWGTCTVTIHTTPQQDQLMLDYIRNRTLHPGIYQVYGRNCATFVYAVLRAAGVKAKHTPFPRDLLNSLRSN
jgi:RHS repeat-associated protein